jgi:hypothetical protein
VPDRAEIAGVVANCVEYWRATGVPRRAVDEMRMELQQHLEVALNEGRGASRGVGDDPEAVAE